MKSRAKLAALTALATACAPVVASAATTYWTDNFNTAASAGKYDQFDQDNDAAADPPYDTSKVFQFDYGAFTYWHVAADFSSQNVSEPIPKAPRSDIAEPKLGLKMEVNNASPTGTAVMSLYPKLAEYANGLPGGDHQMTFDLWMNYAGRFEGALGSTEFATAGLLQAGGGIGGAIAVGDPNLPGVALAWNGDRGNNNRDYRTYHNNTDPGGGIGLNAAAGYVAIDEGTSNPGPADGRNQFYQTLFPRLNPNNANELWHETSGAMGKHWQTITMKVEDGIVYYYVKPEGAADFTLLAARTDESYTSGHLMVGYADFNSGVCLLEDGDGPENSGAYGDHNFAVMDNLVVESTTQTRQKWNVDNNGNWSETAKWLNNDDADGKAEVADFTTVLSTARTVNVDSNRTVRSITFDSTNAGYTLSGAGGGISLDSLTSGIRGKVKAVTGSHLISTPVTLPRPITFDVATGASVKVSDMTFNIVQPNADYVPVPDVLIKNGGGVAEVNRVLELGSNSNLQINAGVLKITPNGGASGVSRILGVTIATGGRLDITDNKLVTRTAVGTHNGTNYTGLTAMIASGRNGNTTPLWDGSTGIITSQTVATAGNLHAIGIALGSEVKNNTVSETATWAGQTITGTDTLVMYTYGGDANLDGKLNIDDYVKIDQGIAGGLKGWSNGDFNYDGVVNIDDYTTVIDSNIGNQSGVFFTGGGVDGGGAGVSAVPEPATMGLFAGLIGGLMLRRRPRKQE